MDEAKIILCEADDPDRCQGPGGGPHSQCNYLTFSGLVKRGYLKPDDRYEGLKYCPKHGGTALEGKTKRRFHDYLKSKWAAQLTEFAESAELKSLRGEVGVVRLLMETALDKCKTRDDLILFQPRLMALADQANRLVVSCDKLEQRMGEVLDKTKALEFANKIVAIIKQHVEDPNVVEAIGDGIIKELASLRG